MAEEKRRFLTIEEVAEELNVGLSLVQGQDPEENPWRADLKEHDADDRDERAGLWPSVGSSSWPLTYPAVELKTEESRIPIPIPQNVCRELSVNHTKWGSDTLVANEWGRDISPHRLEHHCREARAPVRDLPEGFRFHDVRHYFASLLRSQGLNVKVVQKNLRHSPAKTTLDTYGHIWPDIEE